MATHEDRPWGGFPVLDDQPGHKFERLVVTPGHRLSDPRRHRRSER